MTFECICETQPDEIPWIFDDCNLSLPLWYSERLQEPIRSSLKLLMRAKNQTRLCLRKRILRPISSRRSSVTRRYLLVRINFVLLLTEHLAIISLVSSELMGAMNLVSEHLDRPSLLVLEDLSLSQSRSRTAVCRSIVQLWLSCWTDYR